MFSDDSSSGYNDDLTDDDIQRIMATKGIAPKVPDAVGPSLPELPPPRPAALPPAPSQPIAAPAPPATTTPATASANATNGTGINTGAGTGTSGDDSASIKSLLAGGADDTDTTAADNASAQAGRDEAATNKYLRSQGAQMAVTPTGQTQPTTDQWGNSAYKPKIVNPARQLPDGDFYRVTTNAEGNEENFRLRDGADGQDFKTDPTSGEQYVTTAGTDGGSKRTVIGQNHFIPAASDMRGVVQDHQANAQAATLAEADASNGVNGAPGLGSQPLAAIKQQHAAVTQRVSDARDYLNQVDTYLQGGGTLSPAQHQAFWTANNTLNQTGPQADTLANELGNRQATIDAARQQRTASTAAARDAENFRDSLSTDAGQTQVKATLGTVLASGALDPQQANRYVGANLVQDNGAGGYTLTPRGMGMLSGGRAPLQPPPTPSQPVSGAQPTSSSPAPGDTTSTPADDPTQPLPVRIARIRQNTLDQQRTILSEFPAVGQPGSEANLKFIRAFQATGSDPRKALQVARVVLGGYN